MSQEKIETCVDRVVAALNTLGKQLEKNPVERDKVLKAFNFIAHKAGIIQAQAMAHATVPAAKFSLDMDLPALAAPVAAIPDFSMPVPRPPLYPAGARGGAPTRSGLTVDEIGGRLSIDARSAAPVSPLIGGVGFIDDEDDDFRPSSGSSSDSSHSSSSSDTSIDGVDFVDD